MTPAPHPLADGYQPASLVKLPSVPSGIGGPFPERRVLDWLPDYDVSDTGEVRRITPVKSKTPVPYVIKNTPDGYYYTVNLMTPATGRPRKIGVHRLVCEAFNGPAPDGKPFVAHWDGDGRNNQKANLRWASQKENLKDRDRHGTHQKGERGNGAKLKWSDVQKIRASFTGAFGEQSKMAAEYGVTVAAINYVVRGKTWKSV